MKGLTWWDVNAWSPRRSCSKAWGHRKHALGTAAALALSVVVARSAAAEPGFATVEFTRVSGWFGPVTDWTTGAAPPPGRSSTWSSPTWWATTSRASPSSVAEGPGAEGLRCEQDHLIVHEEAWPTLTVETRAAAIWTQDSIDVYAEAGGHDAVHAGQNFKIDTST
ncbi:hypothetical protein [Lentzea sp. NBRC 102530]|uniref:hypothetical protein n=1 Tax=Lentzea sp. NBRC 102530 TaxID=3032201 RepID=UPI0025540A54|nr:hypothetical protein [Lentzea sp. NBRC 102530]